MSLLVLSLKTWSHLRSLREQKGFCGFAILPKARLKRRWLNSCRPILPSVCRRLFQTLSQAARSSLWRAKYSETWQHLGRLRCALADKLDIVPHDELRLLWVVNFPLFEYDDAEKRWVSVTHHLPVRRMGGRAKSLKMCAPVHMIL